MSRKKTYILDTSVYLTNADCVYQFKNSNIQVPLKVFEEIDKHKKRQDAVGLQARKAIRTFDSLRGKGSLDKGVRIRKGKGLIKAVSVGEIKNLNLPEDLDMSIPDHLIIATALRAHRELDGKVILVSRDINMRVIADALGLQAEDYLDNIIVENHEKIFTGLKKILIDDQEVDKFYNKGKVFLDAKGLYPNQYVMLISNSNDKKSAIAKYISKSDPLEPLITLKRGAWGIKPRNKEQSFLLDALMDPKIMLVTAIGRAGSGKTLCAIAAALEQTLDEASARYSRVIVSRPIQPLGKDIGFLPGTMEEKMSPWLMPIQDNLQFLMGNDKVTLSMYLDRGTIEIEALTYIRGRSIANAFIIIDEAQNLTAHELKTIITRVGEGTKIVLTGDVEQIDNAYIDARSNGLTYAVEKFKSFELAAHVTLEKGERSRVASFAAKNL